MTWKHTPQYGPVYPEPKEPERVGTVERVSGWHSYDSLNGKPLTHGEVVSVQWPDGWITDGLVVEVMTDNFQVSDHGSPYACSRSRAVVRVKHRDVEAIVPLVDRLVLRTPPEG